MKLRLYLRWKEGFAGTARLRYEGSFAGAFVPGVFDSLPLARSAADLYLRSRSELVDVQIKDDATGETLEFVTREPITDDEAKP